jgi:hypothetical protein
MNKIESQILSDWFNQDISISTLQDKYSLDRKDIINLIKNNLNNKNDFLVVKTKSRKSSQRKKRKKWFRPDLLNPLRPSFDNNGKRIWYGETDDMIHQTLYFPHELKAILLEEVETGGFKSMADLIRIAISEFLDE